MRLELGDCLEVLKTIPDNSVDSIVTDPPYGLSFMNKKWDYDVPSVEIWTECLRVLKPGGHLLSFGGSRTYHRMAVRIEDAGFDIRDQIMWIYGSGFPKSHNIGKAVDKLMGNEREVVGEKEITSGGKTFHGQDYKLHETQEITKGQSEWEGWGTALKPAHEPIVVARKPLSEKSVAENVLKWGTGGLNIDVSRVGTEQIKSNGYYNQDNDTTIPFGISKKNKEQFEGDIHTGRFPANIILDEEAGELLDQQSGESKGTGKYKITDNKHEKSKIQLQSSKQKNQFSFNDKGGASRFFYCAKTSKKDRDEGLDEFEEKQVFGDEGGTYQGLSNSKLPSKNHHPTVKPTSLMEYLIKLVTPVGGTVMDPFMGSGSTGKASVRNGFDFIGIEREEEYIKIAEARIKNEL